MSENYNQEHYENGIPMPNKFLKSDGTVRTAEGNLIREVTEDNIKRYTQSIPIPDKFLHPDGSIKDLNGNTVENPSEFNIQRYEQAVPIPAKFLNPDGSITSNIGGGEGQLKYHLYAWDYGKGFCVGYTEKEVPVEGDLLFLKQDMEEGRISDPTELKMIYHVISDADGVITVSEHPEGQSGYTFTRNPDDDYEETIYDVRDTVDVSDGGFLMSQKGTVFKGLNINKDVSKVYAWYNSTGVRMGQNYYAKMVYTFSENPKPGNKIYFCSNAEQTEMGKFGFYNLTESDISNNTVRFSGVVFTRDKTRDYPPAN